MIPAVGYANIQMLTNRIWTTIKYIKTEPANLIKRHDMPFYVDLSWHAKSMHGYASTPEIFWWVESASLALQVKDSQRLVLFLWWSINSYGNRSMIAGIFISPSLPTMKHNIIVVLRTGYIVSFASPQSNIKSCKHVSLYHDSFFHSTLTTFTSCINVYCPENNIAFSDTIMKILYVDQLRYQLPGRWYCFPSVYPCIVLLYK